MTNIIVSLLILLFLGSLFFLAGHKLSNKIVKIRKRIGLWRLSQGCSKVKKLHERDAWWCSMKKPILWAHAGGGRFGVYMNCKEAISDSIARGFKIIEIDVDLTSDAVPVLTHRFRPNNEIVFDRRPTLSEFLGTPIGGCFTPMALASVFDTFKDFPGYWAIDSWGIVNSGIKFDFPKYISEIAGDAMGNIIYLANGIKEGFKVSATYDFASVHCGLPEDIDSAQGIWQLPYLVRAYKNVGVRSVTLMDREISSITREVVSVLRNAEIQVSICGVESYERLKKWMEVGAECFNTDRIDPKDLM